MRIQKGALKRQGREGRERRSRARRGRAPGRRALRVAMVREMAIHATRARYSAPIAQALGDREEGGEEGSAGESLQGDRPFQEAAFARAVADEGVEETGEAGDQKDAKGGEDDADDDVPTEAAVAETEVELEGDLQE